MFHISPETLRRFPILGVLIGVSIAVVVAFLIRSAWSELGALLGGKSPEPVSVHEAVTLAGTRWITVSGGEWHRERARTIERRPGVLRWLKGPVEGTEVPLTGTEGGEILVAAFAGAVSCPEQAGRTLTGVIGSREIFSSDATMRRWGRDGSRVAVLHVGASPRTALIMLIALLALAAFGLVFAGYYIRFMVTESRDLATPTRPRDPIQPA